MTKVWQIWNDLEPYVLQVLLGATALFALGKDWEDYAKKFGRIRTILLFTATIAVICLTLFETHNSRRETREKEQAAAVKDAASTRQIETLTDQIRQERDENKDNANGFRQSFDALSMRYSDLAAKTQNARLLRELAETQEQLKSTESKLGQPKARLEATFWNPNIHKDEAIHEVTLPKQADGSVAIDLTVLNLGDTPALNGAIVIRICSTCKYAKEPAGLVRLAGAGEQDRSFNFQHLLSHTADERRTIELIPPPQSDKIQIDINFACENCVTSTIPMWVNIR